MHEPNELLTVKLHAYGFDKVTYQTENKRPKSI